MHKNKIHRADVMAAQNTTCPSCGYSIPPAEIQRVSTEEMKCPRVRERVCGGEHFTRALSSWRRRSDRRDHSDLWRAGKSVVSFVSAPSCGPGCRLVRFVRDSMDTRRTQKAQICRI